jgi:two-component system response regulator FixJ
MNKSLLVHVLDDDSAVRDSLDRFLRSAGFNVRTHDCARSFFDVYRPETTGCVLVDMRMPDATGAEVQDRIARTEETVPVIIITGHANIRMAVTAMKRGAVEFLEKPVDPQLLLDHVDKALKCREYELSEREKADAAQAKFGVLTPRERDVLKHLLVGRPNKIIARELGLSPRTVEIHRARVMEKTGAGSLPRLVRMALAAGMDPDAALMNQGTTQ